MSDGQDDYSAEIAKNVAMAKVSAKRFHSINNSLAILYGKVEQISRKASREDYESLEKDISMVMDRLEKITEDVRSAQFFRGRGTDSMNSDELWQRVSKSLDVTTAEMIDAQVEVFPIATDIIVFTSAVVVLLDELASKGQELEVRFRDSTLHFRGEGVARPEVLEIVRATLGALGASLAVQDSTYTIACPKRVT